MQFLGLLEGIIPEYRYSGKPYKKSPMSKKTKKNRAKNKAARKSRKKNK